MAIYAVRTTTGREHQVIDKMKYKIKKDGADVYAILRPRQVKGYFFVEAESPDEINKVTYKIKNAKGVVGEVSIKEVEHFLVPTMETIKIRTGDTVEIISGPFKGEKAVVKRITKVKEEVVVELLEAAVPIPVTVKLDSVRVIKSEDKQGEEE